MDRFTIVDVETTGIWLKDRSLPKTAEGQPRIIEAALINLGTQLEEENRVSYFIRPVGWTLDPALAAQLGHGYTTEMLMEKGIPVTELLAEYEARIAEGRVIVAHNAHFDCRMMRAELERAGRDEMIERTRSICTMTALKGKVPGASNLGPKLEMAFRHFFYANIQGQHTAMGDAVACMKLFREITARGWRPEPRTWQSKSYDSDAAKKPADPSARKGAPF